MQQFTIKLYAIGGMDPVSVNDANKFIKFFFADLPLFVLATGNTISRSKILVGCFGATDSVMLLFLDILLAVGRSSTSLVLFLVDVNVDTVSEISEGALVEATKVVFRTGVSTTSS